jgi:hypothetical protein
MCSETFIQGQKWKKMGGDRKETHGVEREKFHKLYLDWMQGRPWQGANNSTLPPGLQIFKPLKFNGLFMGVNSNSV